MLEKKFQDQDKYLLRANSCVAWLALHITCWEGVKKNMINLKGKILISSSFFAGRLGTPKNFRALSVPYGSSCASLCFHLLKVESCVLF